MIRNFAVVGALQATRERLVVALQAAPNLAVYRIGRGADPLPVAATFDPADQGGCRSLLDWFERGAPEGAVLLVDDWRLCHELDQELPRVVQWIAAFGPARGVQVVVTARTWEELPVLLKERLWGLPTDYPALHGVEPDLSNVWQRRGSKAAIGVDERGWPVYLDMNISGHGLQGTYLGPDRGQHIRAAVLGLMVTHAPDDLQVVFIDGKGSGVFGNLVEAPHVAHAVGPDLHILDRLETGLRGEISRRQELLHQAGARNSWDYRQERDAGADLEPLADLLICADSVEAVEERLPGFAEKLKEVMYVGRSLGVRVLLSGDEYPEVVRGRVPEWPKALPTNDFAEVEKWLPGAMTGGAIPHQIMLPPLHQMGDLTADMVKYGSVGVVDNVFEQRRDIFYLACAESHPYGVLVGAPGTGKTTALRMIVHALGPDMPMYQIIDGTGEPFEPGKLVIMTARTWAEVPEFVLEKLAFGVEFRLDDPSTSKIGERSAKMLPDHPGIALFWNRRLAVRFARPTDA